MDAGTRWFPLLDGADDRKGWRTASKCKALYKVQGVDKACRVRVHTGRRFFLMSAAEKRLKQTAFTEVEKMYFYGNI